MKATLSLLLTSKTEETQSLISSGTVKELEGFEPYLVIEDE